MPHFFHHHLHRSHIDYDEFSQVFFSRSLRALSASLISIFIPIYLVQVIGSIEQALPFIVMFFVGLYFLRFLLSPFAAMLIARYGAKHMITVSAFLMALAFLALAFLEGNLWLLIPAIILKGASIALFFISLHVDLSMSARKRNTKQVSTVAIVQKLAMATGPLIGGLIAGKVGIFYAFVASIIVLAASTIPLRFNKEPTKLKKHFRLSDLKKVKAKHNVAANIGMGMNGAAASHLWPLFIFTFIGSYEGVGVVISLSLVLSIFIMRFVAIHDSSNESRRQVKAGSGGVSFVHALRTAASGFGSIASINFLNDITFSTLVVPYMSKYYSNTRKTNRLAYVTQMEMGFSLGVTLFWLAILVMALFTSVMVAMYAGFMIAAVAVIFSQFIEKEPYAVATT